MFLLEKVVGLFHPGKRLQARPQADHSVLAWFTDRPGHATPAKKWPVVISDSHRLRKKRHRTEHPRCTDVCLGNS